MLPFEVIQIEKEESLVIACILYIFLSIIWYKKNIKLFRFLLFSVFFIYVVGVWIVCFTPLTIPLSSEQWNNMPSFGRGIPWVQIIPFGSISDILSNHVHWTIPVKQIGGNVLLLFLAGILMPMIWRQLKSWKQAFVYGVLISFCIEILQLGVTILLGFYYKMFDIDDIMLNLIGFLLGFGIYKFLKKFVRIWRFKSKG